MLYIVKEGAQMDLSDNKMSPFLYVSFYCLVYPFISLLNIKLNKKIGK